MQCLRPHPRLPESKSAFQKAPRSCLCTLKSEKHCWKPSLLHSPKTEYWLRNNNNQTGSRTADRTCTNLHALTKAGKKKGRREGRGKKNAKASYLEIWKQTEFQRTLWTYHFPLLSSTNAPYFLGEGLNTRAPYILYRWGFNMLQSPQCLMKAF